MSEPYTQDELLAALRQMNTAIAHYFATLSTEQFFQGSEEVWSAAHHVQHLTQSNKPVAMGLAVPKLLLKIVALGKSPQASRSYSDIRTLYRQTLATGTVRATGRYAPKLESSNQTAIIQTFADAAESVVATAAKWHDSDLDEYALPHPVIGQLSVREMLFFTLYHNSHHLEGVRSKLS